VSARERGQNNARIHWKLHVLRELALFSCLAGCHNVSAQTVQPILDQTQVPRSNQSSKSCRMKGASRQLEEELKAGAAGTATPAAAPAPAVRPWQLHPQLLR